MVPFTIELIRKKSIKIYNFYNDKFRNLFSKNIKRVTIYMFFEMWLHPL